ncbi:ribose transport system ATP-binding protein/D-xylose transport system ATP-binding protein [Psychrobacillus sp. OK028]|uniref:sugar ABC transporter ATP-binding protein n=1 Tax=Psychrobacillus sp. OK028 TaxID=1884359 RepID=UPI000888EDE8|nr:sugar ABC transporter ATP-binding protein [Psychrobacillus sp. OK028]SDM37710.1 ribose transport system ATP-binding protein/D-xylose transport system ATP-binding protein [Psychrobacillus sp. OK028]
MKNSETAIEFNQISKFYPGVKALSNIKFSIQWGTIVGLAGENGSGKSTLLKLLTGIEKADEGEVKVRNKPIHSIKDSIQQKISMVTQEPSLVDELSIAENVIVNQPGKWILNWKEKEQKTDYYLQKLGLNLNVKSKAGSLSPDQQQLVSIARALSTEPDILLLDEATSSLTDDQTELVLNLLKEFKGNNKIVIFISHKLKEYLKICDEIIVLRDSDYICKLVPPDWTEEIVISSMVGRELTNLYPMKRTMKDSEKMLSIENLKMNNSISKPLNVDIKTGEIFVFSGLVGCGRSEILRALIGEVDFVGDIQLAGKPYPVKNTVDAFKKGITLIPAERKSEGIVGHLSVYENAILGIRSKKSLFGLIKRKDELKIVHKIIEDLGVKTASVHTPIENLSGGNQQKVILGKAISIGPKVLLLDEPTRGIDVGAKAEIYHLLRKLSEEGLTVIISSSDLQEVIGVADRVGVMFRGELKTILTEKDVTEENIMYYATGND